MTNVLESKIQKDVIAFLKRKHIYHFRFQAQSNLNGLPDILCLYKGFFLGLELKQENGRPTALQLRKIKTIEENGGIGRIIRSVSEVETLINDIYEGVYERFKN